MSRTIDDFTNFFNPNKVKEKFSLNKAIDEALLITNKLLQKESIKINKDYESIEVVGVLNELSQVIINLIQNSSEAFVLKNSKERNISISIKSGYNYAIIRYKDDAGGAEDKILDKIFEPYFTTKHQSNGTGLGLFMSKMIIEKSLDGTIEARNNDTGLEFIIKIPLGE